MRAMTWANGVSQEMFLADDHLDDTLRVQAKGLKVVLEERGLWKAGLKAQCKICPVNCTTCCARESMVSQSDFKVQVRMIEERIVSAGHQVISYIKFHCELNFIENVWKASTR